MAARAQEIEVAGRAVRLSNAEKVYFAAVDGGDPITKGEVFAYYAAVAPLMLPGLLHRPTTLERWPDGVVEGAEWFYQKRVPKGAPDWVRTVEITFPSGRTADEICPTEEAVIAWAANLGSITFHPWPVRDSDVDHPDELRLDFDPQPGTDFDDAADMALLARELLSEHGITSYAKTSGGRGVHVYVRVRPQWSFTALRRCAIAVGRELERRAPGRVTTAWWKEERGERVFVDYNQNARDRTIAAAYSVRARPGAPTSLPVAWAELREVRPGVATVRTAAALLAARDEDPWAGIDSVAYDLAPLLAMYDADVEERGLGDLPYPPDYPKMPGEPKRVQPSRDADRH